MIFTQHSFLSRGEVRETRTASGFRMRRQVPECGEDKMKTKMYIKLVVPDFTVLSKIQVQVILSRELIRK